MVVLQSICTGFVPVPPSMVIYVRIYCLGKHTCVMISVVCAQYFRFRRTTKHFSSMGHSLCQRPCCVIIVYDMHISIFQRVTKYRSMILKNPHHQHYNQPKLRLLPFHHITIMRVFFHYLPIPAKTQWQWKIKRTKRVDEQKNEDNPGRKLWREIILSRHARNTNYKWILKYQTMAQFPRNRKEKSLLRKFYSHNCIWFLFVSSIRYCIVSFTLSPAGEYLRKNSIKADDETIDFIIAHTYNGWRELQCLCEK